MKFLIDENVDVRVAAVLTDRRHDVVDVKAILGEGTDDPEVVADALREYRIIVTRNHKHFHPHALEARKHPKQEMRRWGLLSLICKPHNEASRIDELHDIILRVHEEAKNRYATDLLLHMEIHDAYYVVHR